MMIGDSGTVLLMISVAVIPSMSGMLMSMRITCGRSFLAMFTAACPPSAVPATSISGSKPISFARLSRVSAMSSTIRMRIFSASAITPLTNVRSRSHVVRAFRPTRNIQASGRRTRRVSQQRSHRHSREPTGDLEGEREESAESERHPVRDPRFHYRHRRRAWTDRRAETAHRDEAERDDPSEQRAIDGAREEQSKSAHRPDRHQVFAIARLQPAHRIERIRDEEADDEPGNVIEETLRHDLAGHAFERAQDKAGGHDGIGEGVGDSPIAPVRVDNGDNESDKDGVLDRSHRVYLAVPLQDGPGGVLRRRPVVVFSSLRSLGEVVADVAEDVRNLAAKEDHRDDNGDGDDGDDKCVLDQTLAFVVAQECEHYSVPLSCDLCASLPAWRTSDN